MGGWDLRNKYKSNMWIQSVDHVHFLLSKKSNYKIEENMATQSIFNLLVFEKSMFINVHKKICIVTKPDSTLLPYACSNTRIYINPWAAFQFA